MSKISELVTGEQVAVWLIIALLVFYFIYKEYPEFKNRISASAVKDQKSDFNEKTVEQRLDGIEADIKEIKEKLNQDFYRINDVETKQKKISLAQQESLEEREIMMRALLAALKGLHELGANNDTSKSEDEINDYLNRKAHTLENK